MYKYLVPKYHEEIFGDSIPRGGSEIFKKLFGYGGTKAVAVYWDSEEKNELTEKCISTVHISDLCNYCKGKEWQKDWQRLIKDIRKNGIKHPLFVISIYPKGKPLFVIEGSHRVGTAALLGIEYMKAFILTRV